MSVRHTRKGRGGTAAVATVAVMVLSLAACGGGDDGTSGDGKAKKPAADEKADDQKFDDDVDTDKVIGELKGSDDIVVRIHSAVRTSGGFVTVNGTLTNEGDKISIGTRWRSEETALKSKSSISGATLVDPAGKKRYMILRDTDGECLCTTGLANIKPDESRPIYAQFPAPPNKVNEVEFHLPDMTPATIELSEG